MSADDSARPNEPHSTTMPAGDPWAEADPAITGLAGQGTAPGVPSDPAASTTDPAPPATRRRWARPARLATIGVCGCLLAGLLVVALPLLRSNGADDGQANTSAEQTVTGAPSVPAGMPGMPSAPAGTSSPTASAGSEPKRETTAGPKPTRSGSSKTTNQPLRLGQLVNGGSGKCLTGGGSGVSLVLRSCNKSLYQRWEFWPDGTIRAGGLCLDLPYGRTDNLTKVSMFDCNGAQGQQFHLNDADDLTSRRAGKCLDAYDGRTTDGTPIVLWPCMGQPNQSWYLK